jgi:hypothetical protein
MFNNSDSDNDIEAGHTHAMGEHSEKFILRTCLRRTTGMRVSIVEKRKI